MSNLTQCNFCSMEQIKKRAEKEGYKVTKLQPTGAGFNLGGVDIFLHPKDVVIEQGNKEQCEKYFVAWFMKLGNKCSC